MRVYGLRVMQLVQGLWNMVFGSFSMSTVMEWNGGILLYRIFDSKNHAIANCEWWVPVLRPLLTMRNPLMPLSGLGFLG